MGRHARGLSPTIGQLRPWHKSIARMMVTGQRPKDVCMIMGLSPAQVSVITNSPLFIEELSRLESMAEYSATDVRSELEMRQGLAIETIDEVLVNKETVDIKLRVATAQDILDRTGYGKQQEPQKNLHLHLHKEVKELSDEDLEREVFDELNS